MRPLARLLYLANRLRWFLTRPITVGVRLILVRDRTVLLVKLPAASGGPSGGKTLPGQQRSAENHQGASGELPRKKPLPGFFP